MILSKEGGDTQPLILRNSYVYVYDQGVYRIFKTQNPDFS